uniref:Uncharacterized protein n=1 Tax=Oryza meridionalis TaxID=40149 RepID=A0A0E0F2D4_9ORYZ
MSASARLMLAPVGSTGEPRPSVSTATSAGAKPKRATRASRMAATSLMQPCSSLGMPANGLKVNATYKNNKSNE